MLAITVTTQDFAHDFMIACNAACVRWFAYKNREQGVVQAYHEAWKRHRDEDVLVYMHDDLEIHCPTWNLAMLDAFSNPKTAIVGFGGAWGLGVPDIYKTPYDISQLVRMGYCSNQTDWEVHGQNETGQRGVAVVDGFFMAISGAFLREVKGWDWIQSNFHCYDLAMCLEAHRRGWEVRMTGVSCTHHGGGTSTKKHYADWCANRGTTMEEEHARPHRWLYEEYRDILPLVVEP